MKQQVTRPVQAHLLRGASCLLMLLAVCVVPFALAQQNVTKQSRTKLGNGLPTAVFHKTLTFPDRVAYHRAIEDVYWRHRIWPKERPEPKPALDAVVSQAQLEKKVTEYLRNSQALEADWQRPLTAEQLQAEMERMASHTKQPDVLREIFEALGNDPFVIAECLARPVLAQRLLTELNDRDRVKLTKVAWLTDPLQSEIATAETQTPKKVAAIDSIAEAAQVNRPYQLPAIASPSGGCTDDTWTPTTLTNAPTGRVGHTAVWTGSEMIVWGGDDDNFGYLNTGGRYNPATDSWTATSTTNAPRGRYLHTAVWTGSEMIVWGGYGCIAEHCGFANSGGRYNPSADSWTAISTVNAPAARGSHTAVWSPTDSEMIVWGGCTAIGWGCSNVTNSGGRYNPGTDSWTATSTTKAPSARYSHTAVWTGSEMIVWGGGNGLNTGGRYNPSTDSWTATSTTNAPSGRYSHTAIWTGSEMIVWGGLYPDLNTGGRYNPGTDSWTATSTTNAPAARRDPTAVWTGSEMIVWGGVGLCNPYCSYLNTGGRYDPNANSWINTSTTNAPEGRSGHKAVWTGGEMIVWGGGFLTNTGGRYCAQSGSPTPTPTSSPTPTATATASPSSTAPATPTATATATATASATATPTATPTATATLTPTPTPTATVTPASTPRPSQAPRPRPTPAPRP
jgi:N-acetylneuraminic acid mutarotase